MNLEQDRIRIGKIIKSHGLKGEFKIYPYTSDISSFNNYKTVYVEDIETPYNLQYIKNMNNLLIGKFKEIDNIDDLPEVLGKSIFIDYSEKRQMQEDEYLISDLIGLEVYERDKLIGVVDDVLQYGANDVFKIKSGSIERFIPNVKKFIKKIDMIEKKITVELIEGM